jgi:hypothetical protein
MPILSSLITRGLSVNNFRKKVYGNVAVQYLVVAGGGGSNFQFAGVGGAGGAGGLKTGTQNTVEAGRLIVTVGGGGTGSVNGSNSSIISIDGSAVWNNVICDGGGCGGGDGRATVDSPSSGINDGQSGGSGGGGRGVQGAISPGGLGYAPQGNNGGSGNGVGTGSFRAGGGGGGAGGAGGSYSDPGGGLRGGAGGAALASSITGTPVNYAGGGAGTGDLSNGATAAPGGAAGSSAPANGGGGAGGNNDGGPGVQPRSGGSGIVILRCIARASNTVGSPIETQVGNEWIYTFTSSGEVVLGAI